MPKIEKILLIVMFFITWIVLAVYAGGPIFSDEFMYIDAGLRNFAEPSYGNRYFHVYLQKFFMELAPTPLWGIRVFWGLLIALTAALVYLNARILTGESGILHGLIAVAFFFSFPLITEYSGEPAVDITAMLMVTIYMSVYHLSLKKPEKRELFAVVLGALAFLSFKTKETTIFINLLLLGYAFDDSSKWSWKQMLDLAKPLLIGLVAGIGVFILLDGFILGRPFFAINPATFVAILNNYDYKHGFFSGPTSWYTIYFLDILMVPFLLFLLSGVKLRNEVDPQHQLLWIFPLAMAAFVSWNMLKITFGFLERFYFPALPAVALLAPQFIRFEHPQSKKQWIGFGLLLAAGTALIIVLRVLMMDYSASLYFDYERFLDSVYYPIVLSVLLAGVIWVRRYNWVSIALPLFCISALLLSPLIYSQKYFFRFPKVRERYVEIFYPFEVFQDELSIQDDDRMYVSVDLDRNYEMLSDDPNEITGMYNFYFDQRISDRNIYMGYTRRLMPDILIEKLFDFALLTSDDWDWLDSPKVPVEIMAQIEDIYQISPDPSGQVYLLTIK